MTARIRPVRREDVAQVWTLVREFAGYNDELDLVTGSPEQLEAKLFSDAWPAIECLVADAGGDLAGFATFLGAYSVFRTQPTLWLEDLFVTESARGRGVGRSLIAAVARVAMARGCWRMGWSVRGWNTPSAAFYERLGAARLTGEHIYLLGGEKLAALAERSGRRSGR